MKKLFVLLLIGIVSLIFASCKPADEVNSNKNTYIGHINIENNTLYLDEIEWITNENKDRIKELGLSQDNDMPNGYYINNPSTDTISFEIAKDTVYSFIATEDLPFTNEGEDRNYSTTKKEEFTEFLKHIQLDRVVFWVEVKDGNVVSITEQFTN